MASIMRPSMLRQSALAAAASKRAFTTKTSSAFPIISKPAARQSVKSAFARSPVAAFHAGGRQQILPPGPQIIDGTDPANDAAKVPNTDPVHGSYHWTAERLVSVGLVPLTLAPFIGGSLNPTMDAVLCATILIHSHIGFESMITDYIPNKRLPKTRKTFEWLLKLATVSVGVGLYEYETNDVGVTETIKRIWKA